MKIIYEDSQIIVCYKESGLAVQSARIGTKDLESILKNYLCCQSLDRKLPVEGCQSIRENQSVSALAGKQTGKPPYLGVIHRLDQPVEGVLVFAKNPQAAASLSAQVTDGQMKKKYQAVVCLPETKSALEGTLVNYLLKDGKSNTSRIMSENVKGAKRAELDYRILQVKDMGKETEAENNEKSQIVIQHEDRPVKIALAEIDLHTGRHHQIRVQMSGAGMPLLGDRKYAPDVKVMMEEEAIPGCCEAEWREMKGQLALCAVSLEFIHPRTGKKMQFTCEPQGEYFSMF